MDAVTAWVFRSLTVDGLPRSLWYTPQHAMACALGLVALDGGRRRSAARAGPAAALLAGVALGGALACSPFLGGAFSLVYGASILFARRGGWRETVRAVAVHAVAAGPVLLALGVVQVERDVRGRRRGGRLRLHGPDHPGAVPDAGADARPDHDRRGRRRSGAAGRGRRVAGTGAGRAWRSGSCCCTSSRCPGGDVVWVGWRAGQILLLTMTPLAALGFAWVADARRLQPPGVGRGRRAVRRRPADHAHRHVQRAGHLEPPDGPGFRWTVVVTPDQRRAFDWIQARDARGRHRPDGADRARARDVDATSRRSPNGAWPPGCPFRCFASRSTRIGPARMRTHVRHDAIAREAQSPRAGGRHRLHLRGFDRAAARSDSASRSSTTTRSTSSGSTRAARFPSIA